MLSCKTSKMTKNVLCLFLYCIVFSEMVSFKFVQSSQCNKDHLFGIEFFKKIPKEDWKNFSDFLEYGYENCAASNLTFTKYSKHSLLEWCFVKNKDCFNWNCSCINDASGNGSLRSSLVSWKCSGNVFGKYSSQDQSIVAMNEDPNCDNTTTLSARKYVKNVSEIKQILPIPLFFMLGTIVGSLLTFCAIHLCRLRIRQRRVNDHSIFSNEIPLNDKELKANQNEVSQCNGEIKATPVYTEIAENIHCNQLVFPAVISNGEYLEPVDKHLIRGRSSQSPVLEKESANVYSNVYNHLNTNYDGGVEACHHEKVTDHIYNVSIAEKKEYHFSEKDAMDLQSASKEGDPTSIRRRSFDKPHEPKNCAGDAMSSLSSCTTKSGEMEINKYEEVERTESVIQPYLSAKNCDEKAYFVLEKKNDNSNN